MNENIFFHLMPVVNVTNDHHLIPDNELICTICIAICPFLDHMQYFLCTLTVFEIYCIPAFVIGSNIEIVYYWHDDFVLSHPP